jgi:hypothetical protein
VGCSGPIDALSFFDTDWEAGGILYGTSTLSTLPNATLLPRAVGRGGTAATPATPAGACTHTTPRGTEPLLPRGAREDLKREELKAARGGGAAGAAAAGHGKYQLVTSVNTRACMDIGPRPLQQDAMQVPILLCAIHSS